MAQFVSSVDLKALPTDELITKIGAQLGEVEGVEYFGERYDGIIVSKIVSCEKHPNADKLNICRIDDGGVNTEVERGDDGLIQVVCGAPNAAAGLTVAWLPPGTVVPSSIEKDPFTLEVREIRGQVSNGMLASEMELGISSSHEGILEIKASDVGEENIKPGTPFKTLYGLDDVVIDIENKMFTHRPDCFGMLGVARELAGIQSLAFKSPDWYLSPTGTDIHETKQVSISIEAPGVVSRFMAVVMDNITVGQSPTWLQAGLSRIGVKSINNIVDITNYISHVLAAPMHAYDYDKVASKSSGGATLTARLATKAEPVALLNGKTIAVDDPAIVIATDSEVVGLAGIMGGSETEVDEHTTSIILECATFDMYSIRRSSTRYGLYTDASTRFTKGQSPLQNPAAIARAMQLVTELASGTQASELYDVHGDLPNANIVEVDAKFINDRLGSDLSADDMATLLTNVEFDVQVSDDSLHITAPFWRTDIAIPEDIVEEVGRLYGYDRLPVTPQQRNILPAPLNPDMQFAQTLRTLLAAAGANEVLTYSFVHGNLLDKAHQQRDDAYQLSNALSPDLQYYRLSITPSLLERVNPNQRAGYDSFALFEMSKTHTKRLIEEDGLPTEHAMLGFTLAMSDKSTAKPAGSPLYGAKTYLEYVADKLGIKLTYSPLPETENPVLQPFEPSRSALVLDADSQTTLGVVGEYRFSVMQDLKLPQYSSGFEIDMQKLRVAAPAQPAYTVLSKFPATTQDISFKLDATVPHGELQALLDKQVSELCTAHGYNVATTTVDIYQPDEENSLKHTAFRLSFTHNDRTLQTVEINSALDQIAAAFSDTFNAIRL